uniref:Uncharacterized protein n=1 Tax=Arundo donax TaxID=35708 RepID=A0A0A9ERE7_ARUDO
MRSVPWGRRLSKTAGKSKILAIQTIFKL